jgi:hypothetical protein
MDKYIPDIWDMSILACLQHLTVLEEDKTVAPSDFAKLPGSNAG